MASKVCAECESTEFDERGGEYYCAICLAHFQQALTYDVGGEDFVLDVADIHLGTKLRGKAKMAGGRRTVDGGIDQDLDDSTAAAPMEWERELQADDDPQTGPSLPDSSELIPHFHSSKRPILAVAHILKYNARLLVQRFNMPPTLLDWTIRIYSLLLRKQNIAFLEEDSHKLLNQQQAQQQLLKKTDKRRQLLIETQQENLVDSLIMEEAHDSDHDAALLEHKQTEMNKHEHKSGTGWYLRKLDPENKNQLKKDTMVVMNEALIAAILHLACLHAGAHVLITDIARWFREQRLRIDGFAWYSATAVVKKYMTNEQTHDLQFVSLPQFESFSLSFYSQVLLLNVNKKVAGDELLSAEVALCQLIRLPVKPILIDFGRVCLRIIRNLNLPDSLMCQVKYVCSRHVPSAELNVTKMDQLYPYMYENGPYVKYMQSRFLYGAVTFREYHQHQSVDSTYPWAYHTMNRYTIECKAAVYILTALSLLYAMDDVLEHKFSQLARQKRAEMEGDSAKPFVFDDWLWQLRQRVRLAMGKTGQDAESEGVLPRYPATRLAHVNFDQHGKLCLGKMNPRGDLGGCKFTRNVLEMQNMASLKDGDFRHCVPATASDHHNMAYINKVQLDDLLWDYDSLYAPLLCAVRERREIHNDRQSTLDRERDLLYASFKHDQVSFVGSDLKTIRKIMDRKGKCKYVRAWPEERNELVVMFPCAVSYLRLGLREQYVGTWHRQHATDTLCDTLELQNILPPYTMRECTQLVATALGEHWNSIWLGMQVLRERLCAYSHNTERQKNGVRAKRRRSKSESDSEIEKMPIHTKLVPRETGITHDLTVEPADWYKSYSDAREFPLYVIETRDHNARRNLTWRNGRIHNSPIVPDYELTQIFLGPRSEFEKLNKNKRLPSQIWWERQKMDIGAEGFLYF